MRIEFFKEGRKDHKSVSHIVFRGLFHEVNAGKYRYVISLNNDLKWIFKAGGGTIFEEGTLFRRTPGGRWILYDSSLYSEAFSLLGRHYMPVPLDFPQFLHPVEERKVLDEALKVWDELLEDQGEPGENGFRKTPSLLSRSRELRGILKSTVPVVPPEAVFFDYDLIPLVVQEGCHANCKFCTVKSGASPRVRSLKEIEVMLSGLKAWFGRDLVNYPVLFLGQHDALSCDISLLEEAAHMAYEALSLKDNCFSTSRLIMFASPLSVSQKTTGEFKRLERLPFDAIHINVGIESLDGATLSLIGRPFDLGLIKQALCKIDEVHSSTEKIMFSTNFLISPSFPCGHVESLKEYLNMERPLKKGMAFISPLMGEYKNVGEVKREVFKLKAGASIPAYLYSIIPYA